MTGTRSPRAGRWPCFSKLPLFWDCSPTTCEPASAAAAPEGVAVVAATRIRSAEARPLAHRAVRRAVSQAGKYPFANRPSVRKAPPKAIRSRGET